MVSGHLTLRVDRALSLTLMEMSTLDSGVKIKPTGKAFTKMRLDLDTRATGRTINNMERELKVGPTDHSTRVNTPLAKKKA